MKKRRQRIRTSFKFLSSCLKPHLAVCSTFDKDEGMLDTLVRRIIDANKEVSEEEAWSLDQPRAADGQDLWGALCEDTRLRLFSVPPPPWDLRASNIIHSSALSGHSIPDRGVVVPLFC